MGEQPKGEPSAAKLYSLEMRDGSWWLTIGVQSFEIGGRFDMEHPEDREHAAWIEAQIRVAVDALVTAASVTASARARREALQSAFGMIDDAVRDSPDPIAARRTFRPIATPLRAALRSLIEDEKPKERKRG